MGKNILAVIGGLVAAFVVIFIIEAISHAMYPFPGNIDFKDPEAMKIFMRDMPSGALIMIIIGWALGSFAGGMATSIIAASHKTGLAFITGVLLMISGIVNLITMPHPVWMWIFGLAVIVPFAYLGRVFTRKKEIVP